MVGNRRSEEVVDPKIPEPPSSKALKRVLLVALRCVDPDANKRPKMGHIIHMLEAEDLLYRDVYKSSLPSHFFYISLQVRNMSKDGMIFSQERRTTRDHGSRERQETAVVAAGSESGESGSRDHQQKLR